MLAGCEEKLSTLHPAGPAAAAVAELWWVMLAGGTLIFLFVMALLALAFRRNGGGGGSARTWIVGLGLIFPVTVLAALLFWGLALGERHLGAGQGPATLVQAEARQWAWTFRYPSLGLPPAEDVLTIPAGQPVDVEITSTDVIHSFWVPRLAGKLDAIPGHVNVLRLQADAPGEYHGLGAEFSGKGYLHSRFTVRALAPADWNAFLTGAPP
ncbi:cytochrome B [Cereibacter sphaeroides]|uniref:cytochrome c oxidase subunit II n=1 Tax=Cereibacter sphaeroides TaxID=1063 RepID=UPI001F19A941|nr:cytochrome B [Cereibacter sphaeroides]MCE6960856.1 cytochrome B [Cereibacter sphaeroides]MCE6974266.1 cytochrome B [Cereibacter sphaeroides]